MKVVTEVDLVEFPLFARGKVRDLFEIDESTLLIVATDRISAFNVVMNEPVPYKGIVLNQLTLFWMKRFKGLVKNHIFTGSFSKFPEHLQSYSSQLDGRSVIVRKVQPLPIECIVRGHLAGSAWAEYQADGTVCGQKLPSGLLESARLENPIFTPSTKGEHDQKDENITHEQAIHMLGKDIFAQVRDISLELFTNAREFAETRGIIIADTKFEFGLLNGELLLIDEVLTPDSSRFWPVKGYSAGSTQPCLDKQPLLDWLLAQPWDKDYPAPSLPQNIIDETAQKYRDVYKIITGEELEIDDL